ncbi:MAG: AAA family ATPase [Patescibacteria group bacterium]
MKKIILGFIGEIASGKGTACDYFIKKHHAGYHRFSRILRDILDRIYLPQTRENMQKMSTWLRKTFSEEIFAKVIAEEVKADRTPIVCVDGIRRPADITHLKKLPNFKLIYVTADEKIRYERIVKRAENADDTVKTFKQFQKDQKQEAESMIAEIKKSANYTVNNNGTQNELNLALEKLLKRIKK